MTQKRKKQVEVIKTGSNHKKLAVSKTGANRVKVHIKYSFFMCRVYRLKTKCSLRFKATPRSIDIH